jgi:hypothetical protein
MAMSEHEERVFVKGHGLRAKKPGHVIFVKSAGSTKRFTVGERVEVTDAEGHLVAARIISRGNRSNPPMAKIDGRDELAILNSHGFCAKLAAGE